MKDVARWKGLRTLIGDAVEHGASAIERVHLATARRPFDVLERIPGIAAPAKGIHQVHDAIVAGTYGAVRAVNRAVGLALDTALDAADGAQEEPHEPHEPYEPEAPPDPSDPSGPGA